MRWQYKPTEFDNFRINLCGVSKSKSFSTLRSGTKNPKNPVIKWENFVPHLFISIRFLTIYVARPRAPLKPSYIKYVTRNRRSQEATQLKASRL